MSILNSLYLVGPYPWDVDDACFMFLVPCLVTFLGYGNV